ncbi:MAG: hypothetical protein GYA24_25365 [Candidatus Lokiarchaeota archaeon]|nr:hypothetical protein [Candidatus Lokiarchaeota archaeon]
MESAKKEQLYVISGIAMFSWLAAVFIYDWRFMTYFSCFSFAIIAAGMVAKLRNYYLNLFTLSYLIVSIYLLSRQAIWISLYGIEADYTYLVAYPTYPVAPWWIHVVMHGVPIPLVLLVMAEKKIAVDWKKFAVVVILLVAWSYTMDVARFIGMPDFWIAYPLGIPLTVVYLLVYGKWIRPKLLASSAGSKKE